jgi:hypothetical protein
VPTLVPNLISALLIGALVGFLQALALSGAGMYVDAHPFILAFTGAAAGLVLGHGAARALARRRDALR